MGKAGLPFWQGLSLKRKLYVVMIGVTLFMAVAILINVKVSYVFIDDVRQLMDDNLSSYKFQESFGNEVEAFTELVRDWNTENEDAYRAACAETQYNLNALPYDYGQIGEERYAITWNILNGYEVYSRQRETTVALKLSDEDYISELYKTYQMQDYLKSYANRLTKEVLNGGNDYYQNRVYLLQQMPYILTAISVITLGVLSLLLRAMMGRIIRVVLSLAAISAGIEKNDFSVPDAEWQGQDEIGQLVSAFNKMKHATQDYVNTLEEKRVIEERLHEQELEQANLEQRFSLAQLQLIKSQLNPHFLFNTLNMITRMSQMEDAPVTEEMLVAMSNLLRYSLRTTEAFTPLNQELKVVEDYMYIQEKRFGERVQWEIECSIDTDQLEIPVFLIQPLVENAIVHGISSKENGGTIKVSIGMKDDLLQITVSDNGVGMSGERLEEIREAVRLRGKGLGIGLGNIHRRLAAYYECGEVIVDSELNEGTTVTMIFGERKA